MGREGNKCDKNRENIFLKVVDKQINIWQKIVIRKHVKFTVNNILEEAGKRKTGQRLDTKEE